MRLDPQTLPPVPRVRPVTEADSALPAAALGGDTIDAGSVAPRGRLRVAVPRACPAPPERAWSRRRRATFGVLERRLRRLRRLRRPGETDTDDADGARRHRLRRHRPAAARPARRHRARLVGRHRRCSSSPAPSTTVQGSTPPASSSGRRLAGAPAPPPAGAAIPIVSRHGVRPVRRRRAGERRATCRWPSTATPSTAWSTLEYRGSPDFGNLKDGVGVRLRPGQRRSRWPG